MTTLLRASALTTVTRVAEYSGVRDKDDYVYNMKDAEAGINADFMSYASYASLGHDPTVLLDPEVLIRETQRVFSVFFQHFVNANLTQTKGGWAYQTIGEDQELWPINPWRSFDQKLPDGSPAPRFEDIPRQNTSRTATGVLTVRVEILRMNIIAFWISTCILAWIIIATVLFIAMQRRHLGGMTRNMECIADVLVLIADSEQLFAVIKEKGNDTIMKEDKIYTRLGWFRDHDGTMRWRIEIVENDQVQVKSTYMPASNGNDQQEGMEGISDSRRSSGELSQEHHRSLRATYAAVPVNDNEEAENDAFPVHIAAYEGNAPSTEIPLAERSTENTRPSTTVSHGGYDSV
jgi:hypothetical protein